MRLVRMVACLPLGLGSCVSSIPQDPVRRRAHPVAHPYPKAPWANDTPYSSISVPQFVMS